MVLTPSAMVALGSPAPDFTLLDTDGASVGLSDFEGQPLLVAFICNHCPYVQHIADVWAAVAQQIQQMGIGVVAISSNDVEEYPEDGPEAMAQEKQERGYTFPYLFDATQEVARAFDARCTPDFFLYDEQHRLAYRGRFDASKPGSGVPVTGQELVAACRAVLSGARVSEQVPSIGCNIKWAQ